MWSGVLLVPDSGVQTEGSLEKRFKERDEQIKDLNKM